MADEKDKKESKQKEHKNICTNELDFGLNAIIYNQDTITIRRENNNAVYCFTFDELKNFAKYDVPTHYTDVNINVEAKFPAIIMPPLTQLIAHKIESEGRLLAGQSRDLNQDLIAIFEKQTNPKHWLYKIPNLEVWVDHTYYDLLLSGVKHMVVYLPYPDKKEFEKLNKKPIFTSMGQSGIHGDMFYIYKVKEDTDFNINYNNENYDDLILKCDVAQNLDSIDSVIQEIKDIWKVKQSYESVRVYLHCLKNRLKILEEKNDPEFEIEKSKSFEFVEKLNKTYNYLLDYDVLKLYIEFHSILSSYFLFEDILERYDNDAIIYESSLLLEKELDKHFELYYIKELYPIAYLKLFQVYILLREKKYETSEDVLRIKNKIIKQYYYLQNKPVPEKNDEVKIWQDYITEKGEDLSVEELKETAEYIRNQASDKFFSIEIYLFLFEIEYVISKLEKYYSFYIKTRNIIEKSFHDLYKSNLDKKELEYNRNPIYNNQEWYKGDKVGKLHRDNDLFSYIYTGGHGLNNVGNPSYNENSDDENSDDENYYHNLD